MKGFCFRGVRTSLSPERHRRKALYCRSGACNCVSAISPLSGAPASRPAPPTSSRHKAGCEPRIKHIFNIPRTRPVIKERIFLCRCPGVHGAQLIPGHERTSMFIFKNFPVHSRHFSKAPASKILTLCLRQPPVNLGTCQNGYICVPAACYQGVQLG